MPSEMAPDVPDSSKDGVPSPELIRAKLEKVMKDKKTFFRSARASFKQFDKDQNGCLEFEEMKELVARLCFNLQLPPVDDKTLRSISERYVGSSTGTLELEGFCQLYWQLLLRIRDKYYPTKKMRVRRDFFVGRQNLKGEASITGIFTFIKKLGAGAFGEVHLVKEKTSGLTRVIKIINKDRSAVPVEQIEAEVQVLKNLDHPNIIKIFEVYEDYNNMYIVMEMCRGGELLQRILAAQQKGRRFSESLVGSLMRQLMNALSYFHSQNVAHKDLKPENIMFQESTLDSPIKVIDFGLAELFERSDQQSHNSAGTAIYMAPEVFRRSFTVKCDVWSAGVIMYFLLSGHLPFTGKSMEELQYKVCFSEPHYKKECVNVSDCAIDLMKLMLLKDPRKRLPASEIIKHSWFQACIATEIDLSPTLKNNLKKYMKQSDLKNALVNMMAHQLNISGAQIQKINDIFRSLDVDGNGTLSHSELTLGLTKIGMPQWDINRILQAIDIDDSGNISYTEFLAACYTWRESELNVLWTAFNKMDTDGDGKISTEEFYRIVSGKESRLIPAIDMKSLVDVIDVNQDGVVDWDEFLEYMRSS